MRYTSSSVAVLCLLAGASTAGGIDRSGQSVEVLFEKGRYAEFSIGGVVPSVSGNSVSALANGGGSGDIASNFLTFSAAYKADVNERWSYALILDEPFGAEVDYATGTGYFAQDSDAQFESQALTGLLQYNAPSGFSVYGGLRLQAVQADSRIIFPSLGLNYTADADVDYGVGYIAGVAYERPDIALRVSLTYNSEIGHDASTAETQVGLPNRSTATSFETPQSVNLQFQTGIAQDTLLFGGVRWVDWSDFALDPSLYKALTSGALLSYEGDVTTYTLGVGRKINENWSLAASIGYEETTGNFFTNLGPNDGQKSIGLSAIYTRDKVKITTGIRYTRIGDTLTRAGTIAPAARFDDNDAVSIGVKVGYYF